jgi:hypothetical protein
MAVTANVTVSVNAALTGDPVGAGTNVSLSLPFAYTKNFTDGTTADKVDKVHFKRYSLTTTPTDIDLAGTLVDALGNATVFVEIAGIFIKNNSTTAGQNVHVGGDANGLVNWVGAAADYIIVRPGGVFCMVEPSDPAYAVTAGTGDILQVVAATGTPSIDLMILGRSA